MKERRVPALRAGVLRWDHLPPDGDAATAWT